MSVTSALARSPEGRRLLDFVRENNIPDNWESVPEIRAYLRGVVLDSLPAGKHEDPLAIELLGGAESHLHINLSVLLALATAYVKQQYAAVEKALEESVKKRFVLYDGRAKSGDADDASVFIVASSEEEARDDGEDYDEQDAIWYEYDVDDDGNLTNPIPRWDLPPNGEKLDDEE